MDSHPWRRLQKRSMERIRKSLQKYLSMERFLEPACSTNSCMTLVRFCSRRHNGFSRMQKIDTVINWKIVFSDILMVSAQVRAPFFKGWQTSALTWARMKSATKQKLDIMDQKLSCNVWKILNKTTNERLSLTWRFEKRVAAQDTREGTTIWTSLVWEWFVGLRWCETKLL